MVVDPKGEKGFRENTIFVNDLQVVKLVFVFLSFDFSSFTTSVMALLDTLRTYAYLFC